jgi:cytochrome P450
MHPPSEYSTLLLAGHDTTASATTWYLWEIAKHPESQDRVRTEITALRARKGGSQFSVSDLDSMTYTLATIKVCDTILHPPMQLYLRSSPPHLGVAEAAPYCFYPQ